MKAPKEHFEFDFKIAFGIFQCNLDCFGGLLDFNSGGKKVIERLVEAYGFNTRQALCDHLGVSKSTMATRYMRDIFPADWVLQCSIETGCSLEWLSFGQGDKSALIMNRTVTLAYKKLICGNLEDAGDCVFDTKLLPKNLQKPEIISENELSYICDYGYDSVRDGLWIINIDGEISVRTITKLPQKRIRVEGKNNSFECAINEIVLVAKVIISLARPC